MKRQIKFRGKRVDNGEWVYGYYLVAGGMAFISSFGVREPVLIDGKTVGQFINKEDKNGKKIFCQDILATKERDVVLMVVWDEETCGYKFKGNESSFNNLGLLDIDSGSLKAMEIIGNIHNNPKLLEGSDQWSN